jgi:TonB-linked SusC/RagA family outer membrane protein
MKKIQIITLTFLVLISYSEVFSQAKSIIRGRVIDKNDKTTIIGANVVEYDASNRVITGTVTNVNGDFVLEIKNPNDIVKVGMIGYNVTTINIDFTKLIIVELSSSDIEIGEITITAKAATSNRLTNIDERDKASSSVKIELMDVQNQGITSAAEALQGKISGLDILSASGDPGSGSQIVIRGLSSMGNNKPLIVIDGIQQDNVPSNFDLSSADSEDISNLINIALQDIKSIEVLKDAASTAVYGSKGADGVLLIETHKGRMGKVQFDYQYKNSINFQPPAIPMLSGDEYIILQLEELHNSLGVFTIPDEIAYNRDYVDFYNYSANTDWLGSITKNSLTHDHYFKISGGGDKTRYFTSFSYVDEDGTTINTNSTRFSTRINLDYFLSKKILFSIQFNYTNNLTKGNMTINNTNIRSMAYVKAPNMSIWEYNSTGDLTGEYFTPITSYQGDGTSYFNPVAVARLGKNDRNGNSLQNTFKLRYNILSWLTFNEAVSFQYDGSKSNNYLPYNAIGADWLAWNVNKAEESNNIYSSIKTETQLAFDSPFKSTKHIVSGAVTWTTNQSGYEWMNLQSNKTPSTDIQDPSIAGQINWIGSGSGQNRDVGALINLNYKYLDRYMLQTSLRADASSSFGSNFRWGLFKGVAVAWRFSSEPFLQSLTWLGESKLRASWGVSGRQPGDPYARFATYLTTSNGAYITNPAIIPSQIQLNNLKWESLASIDVGLELNLFKDRLFIQGDFYKKVTSDLLFGGPPDYYKIPTSSGFDHLNYYNGGELLNKGWELMMNYRVLRTNNLTLSLDFNTSQNVNSFEKLPDNFNSERSTSIGNGVYPRRVVAGEPIGSFFGFKYLGVFPSDADAIAKDAEGNILHDSDGVPIPMTYQGSYVFRGGDAHYEDVNHDGKIDLNDVQYIGDSNPNFIGGFGSTLKYKNFDISFSFLYRLGFDIVNGVAIKTEGMTGKNNQSKAVLSRWRKQGQDEPGMLPRAFMYHPCNNLGSDRYVEKGDFIRLNNVKFGYRFKKEWCDKLGLNSLNLAVSARKLLTFTKYTGQDPEISQNASDPFWIGVDNANTPPPKMVTFSISVGF